MTFSDGTIEYYKKIRELMPEKSKVLDFGSGRGSWIHNDDNIERRQLRDLHYKKSKVIGVDIDDAVLSNSKNDENYILTSSWVEENKNTFDLITADFVLEHIADKKSFFITINKLLKKGGFFCARTPHKYSYIAILSMLTPTIFHKAILKKAQPNREHIDVFKAYYRLNTLTCLENLFVDFKDKSYIYTPEPAYFVKSRLLRYLLCCIHKFLPRFFSGQLFIFKKKVNGI